MESVVSLQSLADRLGASLLESSEDLTSLENPNGQEIWRWLLLGLLGLLVVEIFLQATSRGSPRVNTPTISR